MQNTEATANPNPESEATAEDEDEGNTGLKVRTNLKAGLDASALMLTNVVGSKVSSSRYSDSSTLSLNTSIYSIG